MFENGHSGGEGEVFGFHTSGPWLGQVSARLCFGAVFFPLTARTDGLLSPSPYVASFVPVLFCVGVVLACIRLSRDDGDARMSVTFFEAPRSRRGQHKLEFSPRVPYLSTESLWSSMEIVVAPGSTKLQTFTHSLHELALRAWCPSTPECQLHSRLQDRRQVTRPWMGRSGSPGFHVEANLWARAAHKFSFQSVLVPPAIMGSDLPLLSHSFTCDVFVEDGLSGGVGQLRVREEWWVVPGCCEAHVEKKVALLPQTSSSGETPAVQRYSGSPMD